MGNEIVKLDELQHYLEARKDKLQDALAGTLDVERFVKVALIAATKNPSLRQATKESLYLAIMESASVGLQPDNREAALVKYGNHAEFMPMVKGIINLMLRSPGVTKVEARAVYESDEFAYNYGLHPDLHHVPSGDTGGTVTHAYAVVWRQGTEPTFEVVTRDEIEAARNASRAPNSPAWKDWYSEMARKVALKRLSKYIDLSPEASRAIEIDHAVIGDPDIQGSYVGPSPEYQRQLTKSKTEEKLSTLKDRISSNGETGDEEEAEPPEPPQAAEADEKETPAQEAEGETHEEKHPKAVQVKEAVQQGIEDWQDVDRETQVQGSDLPLWQYTRWMLAECFGDKEKDVKDAKAHTVSQYLVGKTSAKDWTGPEAMAILSCLEVKDNVPSERAVMGIRAVLMARQDQLGVQTLPGLEP